jgi:hypothetical protein
MANRIYVVNSPSGDRLVEAANKAQAINFVVSDIISAHVASQADLVSLIQNGVLVEGILE